MLTNDIIIFEQPGPGVSVIMVIDMLLIKFSVESYCTVLNWLPAKSKFILLCIIA